MKPKIVILNIHQFGYHTDTYNYCRFLKSDFNITYISFHQGFEDIQIDGLKTITILQPRGFLNLLRGYLSLAGFVKKEAPVLVFIVYSRFIAITKFFIPKTRFIFDIRTGSLFENSLKRFSWNLLLWTESLIFNQITIISEGLRRELKLPARKCHWIPLGGNRLNRITNISSMRLLYIGTLDQRKVHLTIEGFSTFKKKFPEVSISYDIVGYGKTETEEVIKSSIVKYNLEKQVVFHGRIPYDQIENYLMRSNVGIVFIPVTSYYNYQPSTKLFEFLLAGIPVLATKTAENLLILNDSNGILIDDSAEGFSSGLELIYRRFSLFDEETIRNTVSDYTWENIVMCHLKPLLMNLLHNYNYH